MIGRKGLKAQMKDTAGMFDVEIHMIPYQASEVMEFLECCICLEEIPCNQVDDDDDDDNQADANPGSSEQCLFMTVLLSFQPVSFLQLHTAAFVNLL